VALVSQLPTKNFAARLVGNCKAPHQARDINPENGGARAIVPLPRLRPGDVVPVSFDHHSDRAAIETLAGAEMTKARLGKPKAGPAAARAVGRRGRFEPWISSSSLPS
jgi:hypothetical protein